MIAPTETHFSEQLLAFINETLPSLDRQRRKWPRIDRATPLFADGLLDSLSILHLIARVEDLTGAPVPDHLVVMRHFQSVDAITAAFCKP